MRKVVLCLVASTALALSSAADAAINITGMSGLTSAPGVTNGSTEDYVDFSANTEPSGDFTSWFTFHNDTPGLYSIKVTTSTIGAMLSSLVLSNNDGSTPLFSYVGPPSDTLSLITDNLGAGDYRLTFGGNYSARPRVSPDGSQLAIVTLDNGEYRIAIQDLGNGTVRMLSKGHLDESPSFAPNGATLIYSEREGGRDSLATVSTDGLTGLRLKAPQGEVREPAWGPFSP